jgi:ribonuclease HII
VVDQVPNLDWEDQLWRNGCRRVVGADEVGIGPIAGPVVAAAVLLPPGCARIAGVRDSKTLSARQREEVAPLILDQALAVAVGAASVAEIERLNILAASRLALRRAIRKIGPCDHALIDGRSFEDPALGSHAEIVDGDALCYSIACASIVAKVARDRLMAKLAARHPEYGWETNAGYPTAAHVAALGRYGITPYHRRGFAPVRVVLESLGDGHAVQEMDGRESQMVR